MTYGPEPLDSWEDYPDDCYIDRDDVPEVEEAITRAAEFLDVPRERLEARAIFMRRMGKVEATIEGREEGDLVVCLAPRRAKEPLPFWHVREALADEGEGE